jgi:hypothetical protein
MRGKTQRKRFVVTVIIASIAAIMWGCIEHDIAAPASFRSMIDGKPLDEKRLSKLRDVGEGCLASSQSPDGAVHAISLPRKTLPFAMPALVHTPGAEGTGHVLEFDMRQPDGRLMTVNCWTPDTLTVNQLAALMQSGSVGAWGGIAASLSSAPVLPSSRERHMSREAQEFEAEMLAPAYRTHGNDPKAMANDCNGGETDRTSNAKRAFSDCTCAGITIEIWISNGAFVFDVTFYGCTYGEYGGGYTYGIDNTTIWPCSGTTVASEQDVIVGMYYNTALFAPDAFGSVDGAGWMPAADRPYARWYPGCSDVIRYELTSQVTAHFQYFELKDPDWNDAILQDPLIVMASTGWGHEAWREAYGAPRHPTSGYRTPIHNADPRVGGAIGSMHMRGVAVDWNNDTRTQDEYDAMVAAARVAQASFIEPTTMACSTDCTHADWRWWIIWPTRPH